MNVHHLELFYYVARHGGISEAVRNIPYGIQQPAVSAQILQLEDSLGATLFQRRPFSLTPSGQKLYEFIRPFFQNLELVESDIRGDTAQQIRIGASEIVLRDHLPGILRELKKKYSNLKVILRRGYQPELEAMLEQQEIDVAMTLLEKKPNPGVRSVSLFRLPLILLVQNKSPIRQADDLWSKDKIEEPLLCLPSSEAICKHFHRRLNQLGVDWYPSIELNSLELIQTYVENGYGIGLSVDVPHSKLSKQLRAIPLGDFEPVDFGVLWHGKPRPIVTTFVDVVKSRALQIIPHSGGHS